MKIVAVFDRAQDEAAVLDLKNSIEPLDATVRVTPHGVIYESNSFQTQIQTIISEKVTSVVPEAKKFPIYGMKCKNCVKKVTDCVQKEDNVAIADVDLTGKSVTIYHTAPVDLLTIQSDLSKLNFKFEESPPPVDSQIVPMDKISSFHVKLRGIQMSNVDRVREELKDIKGIFRVIFDIVDKDVLIEYNPEITNEFEISDVLEKLGRLVVPTKDCSDSIILDIIGMTCSSCVSKIESHLTESKGVTKAVVNLMTNTATIHFKNDKIGVRDLIACVEGLGFQASIHHESANQENSFSEEKYWRWRLGISVFFTIPVVIMSMIDTMIYDQTPKIGVRWIEVLLCILTAPVHFWCGFHFHSAAFHSLRNIYADMNVLISLATNTAFFYSLFLLSFTFISSQPTGRTYFFETCAMLIGLMNLGKYLESLAKKKTSNAISELINLQSKHAHLIREDETEEILRTELLQKGDLIKILPGESVPTDGLIVKGESSMNESMLTGEGDFVTKTVGDQVIGGTINNDGVLFVKVTKIGAETLLAQIVRLVKESQGSKAPIQRYADYLSKTFVPVVVGLAFMTFLTWFMLAYTGMIPTSWIPPGSNSFLFSLLFSMAVLVVACPCAFGLATPTAVMVSTGLAAKLGILIKGGEPLELAHTLTCVCFDKTGTLTHGKPSVQIHAIFDYDEEKYFSLVSSLEKNSDHPMAKSLFQYSKDRCQSQVEIDHFKNIPGQGVEGKVNGKLLIIGSQKFVEKYVSMSSDQYEKVQDEIQQARTIILVMYDMKILGFFSISDSIKPEAKLVVDELKKMGIKTILLSGDRKEVVDHVASQLDIKVSISSVLPGQKLQVIKNLQSKGFIVGMVGDGINDSPSLSQADVGIAIGSGSDISIESADIILVKSDLRDLLNAIDLSKKTFARIRLNHFWALGYNVVLIPLAMGFAYPSFGIVVPPMLAAAMMSSSSIIVILSSLLLRWYQPIHSK
jgi:Cu+-exporting ATPase